MFEFSAFSCRLIILAHFLFQQSGMRQFCVLETPQKSPCLLALFSLQALLLEELNIDPARQRIAFKADPSHTTFAEYSCAALRNLGMMDTLTAQGHWATDAAALQPPVSCCSCQPLGQVGNLFSPSPHHLPPPKANQMS